MISTMHSTTNAYASEPAVPLLAHSLLQHDVATAEDPPNTESAPTNPSLSNPDWNLEHDIRNGVEYPPMGIFGPGTVIGFSFMRNDSKEGDDLDHIGQV